MAHLCHPSTGQELSRFLRSLCPLQDQWQPRFAALNTAFFCQLFLNAHLLAVTMRAVFPVPLPPSSRYEGSTATGSSDTSDAWYSAAAATRDQYSRRGTDSPGWYTAPSPEGPDEPAATAGARSTARARPGNFTTDPQSCLDCTQCGVSCNRMLGWYADNLPCCGSGTGAI